MKQKILIDTDIGDNPDDAFAILAALTLPFEIVGITTVFRDTVSRGRMVKKLLQAFGSGLEKIPVYAGYSGYSDRQEENDAYICQFSEDLYCPLYTPDGCHPDEAVDFIIDSCNRWGNELTVVAIGPFSNLAKVIDKDPYALKKAGKVVVMGGAYFRQYADWNVMCDVPAADLMFRSLPNLECIGADVTHLLPEDSVLTAALTEKDFGNEAFRYVRNLYRVWQERHPSQALVLHDVLAVYYALDPTICTTKELCVQVITQGYAKGLTLNVAAYNKSHLNSLYRNYDFTTMVQAASSADHCRFQELLHRSISSCTAVKEQE